MAVPCSARPSAGRKCHRALVRLAGSVKGTLVGTPGQTNAGPQFCSPEAPLHLSC